MVAELTPVRSLRRHVSAEEVAFVLFLLVLLVGLHPFRPRDITAALVDTTQDGDPLTQVTFAGFFAAAVIRGFWGRKTENALPMPASLVLLLGWMLLSAVWSQVPDLTFRRAVLMIFQTVPLFVFVQSLGPARAFQLMRTTIIIILLADLASVVLLPNLAIHQSTDYEPAIIGGWRGLHYHKNVTGPLMALFGLFFLTEFVEKRSRLSLALLVLAVIMLAGTRSKSALGFFLALMPLQIFYCRLTRNEAARGRTLLGTLVLGVFVVGLAIPVWPLLSGLLDDRELFTGRGTIWQIASAFIDDHLIQGAGFTAFWRVGAESPVRQLGMGWATTVAHSHNGYLELLVGLGLPGLILGVLSGIVLPFRRLALDPPVVAHRTMFIWLVYLTVQNIIESNILQRLNEVWTIHALLIALSFSRLRKRADVRV